MKPRRLFALFILTCLAAPLSLLAQSSSGIYEVQSGKVEFHSNAPKEYIQASSQGLKGVVDVARRSFAFRVDMASFMGFNSPLQREHFNENYMQTSRYPDAHFTGKILEDIDLGKDGAYNLRAKGKLEVHGLSRERIIPVKVTVKGGRMSVESDFIVELAEHDINIPRVVFNKLAPEINVSVRASLLPRI